MPLPSMSPEQLETARVKAAEARRAQSEIIAKIKSGQVPQADVLAGSDTAAARIRVRRAVQALPGVGPARTASALEAAGIAENRRVGGITDGQRERLLNALEQ